MRHIQRPGVLSGRPVAAPITALNPILHVLLTWAIREVRATTVRSCGLPRRHLLPWTRRSP